MKLDKTKVPFEKKLRAVTTYIATGKPLRKIAQEMDIPFQTLWFWVNQYKSGGEEILRQKKTLQRRITKDRETSIMMLKEQNPSLSIRDANQLLKKQGIRVSNNTIWHIWKRYGLTKRPIHDPISPFCEATIETKNGIERAGKFLRDGDFKSAANMLNSLPGLPENKILKQIPENLLSPRRRLERLFLMYGEIPFSVLYRKARLLGKILENKGLIYSSIYANFYELAVLDWIGKPQQKATILTRLRKKMHNMSNTALWFFFHREEVITYCNLLKIGKAIEIAKKCRKLLYRLPSSYRELYGTLLGYLGRFKESTAFYKTALEAETHPQIITRLILRIATISHGEYEESKRMLSKIKKPKGLGVAYYNLAQAHIAFGQGNLTKAKEFFLESLEKAFKQELYNVLYVTSMGLACVARALNRRVEATVHLKKYLPLMKKCGLTTVTVIFKQLLGSGETIPEELLKMPNIHLLNLLVQANRTSKIANYRKAFNYASKQSLMGLFHRWIIFCPDPVFHLLEKGKNTGLPRTILKFPIFNQNIPVYHVKFLGNVNISKDQCYVRAKLSPQEKAFLVHLALRSGAPGKSIPVSDLYKNFWKQSTRPSERLLHLLVQLKKKLMLPGHLLSISSTYAEPRLINRGIYITTDYDEFQTLLAQAKSLEQADEWNFAKRDYLRAFNSVRDAPFKKMYDNWSESMRDVILNRVEHETINFTKGCIVHKNQKDAKRVLEKITKIIPPSQETKKLLDELRS